MAVGGELLKQEFPLQDGVAVVLDAVPAERQLDPERIARRQQPVLGPGVGALRLGEGLDLAAAAVDEAGVVGDEGPRRVGGVCCERDGSRRGEAADQKWFL